MFWIYFISGQETAFPAMADDMTTDEIDGFANGQEMIWIFTTSDNIQYRLFPSPNQNYLINAVYYVGQFDYDLNCSHPQIYMVVQTMYLVIITQMPPLKTALL